MNLRRNPTAILLAWLMIIVGITTAQRDHGDACSLRSQLKDAILQRESSGEGCMTSKGLVCFNHKCICADPSDVYEIPADDPPSSSSSISGSSIATSVIGFFKGGDKDKNAQPAASTGSPNAPSGAAGGGKCVGRAGSPCFTQNSTCVKHAICEGTPRMCKCQGIHGSNTQGRCSKTANLVGQVVKQIGK